MTTPIVLRIAICLYPDLTTLDYQGPAQVFSAVSKKAIEMGLHGQNPPKYAIETEYLSHTLDPVISLDGPPVLPSRKYDDIKPDEQFDMLLVPGGPGSTPELTPSSLLEFIKRQAPGAKHVLSVCSGSWILAKAGVLTGKKATTNKSWFKAIEEETKPLGVQWVAKARWVADEADNKKIWTSSGVTAGLDMANAFLQFLVGDGPTKVMQNIIELRAAEQGDDEFAVIHGLVSA